MSCEICGRSSCCRTFHSLEEQENFDNIADNVKERTKKVIFGMISNLNGHYHGNNYYVNLDEIKKCIDKYD